MTFLQLWLTGYYNPARVVEELGAHSSPRWGFYAALLRALLDSLLLYLPLALLGRQPSTPSMLTFLPTERYYAGLVFLAPAVLMAQWLMLCAVVHLVLRLLGRPGDIDRVMNLSGVAALIVGAFLLPWDWLWVALGWHDPVLLGISHLLLDLWGMAIVVLGFKRLLGLPLGLAIGLNVLWVLLGIPLGILFMRPPF